MVLKASEALENSTANIASMKLGVCSLMSRQSCACDDVFAAFIADEGFRTVVSAEMIFQGYLGGEFFLTQLAMMFFHVWLLEDQRC